MPVFDFSKTPDAKPVSECTYTIFRSNESEASPERPLLVLDNSRQAWAHHSCGVFTHPGKRTAFEFKEETGPVSADILQIDADGAMTRGRFDCSALLGWEENPWLFSSRRHRGSGKQEADLYLEELRAVAPSFGYAPEAVDRLSARGFSP